MSSSKPRLTSLVYISFIYFTISVGINIWRSSFYNYANDVFNLNAVQIGALFSVASIPGFIAFSVGFISRKVRLSLLLLFACVAVGGGLAWIGTAASWNLLWIGVLLISTGLTTLYPVINSIVLQSDSSRSPFTSLGAVKSFGPLSALASTLLIAFLLQPLGYRFFFIVCGVGISVMGLGVVLENHQQQYAPNRGNLKFKSNLWPYYMLNFLAGCRSATFKIFVLYLMVNRHGFRVDHTAILVLVGNLLGAGSYCLLGNAARRIGSRKTLFFTYICVAMIFTGFYLFYNNWIACSILYGLDSILFGVSVVTDGWLKNNSQASNYVGDIAIGYTLFHLASILLPPITGLIWETRGADDAFLIGSGFAILAAVVSRKLHNRNRA